MNILHLLSQNHLTGSEVYAAQLIADQVEKKNNVFQISNGFFSETLAKKYPLAVETKSFLEFIKNVFWLRQFLIKEKIQVIHTHSRASAKLAFWARSFLKIGMVSTIHGRQHPSLSKKIHNQYGDFLIAVCETLETQLLQNFKYNSKRLQVIKNPISSESFNFKKIDFKKNNFKIAIIGRTTGPKGKRTELILNAIINQFKKLNLNAEFFLVGGSLKDLNLDTNLDTNLNLFEKKISSLTSKDYYEFDLVIGSGRVAIESIISGIPTISFGEAKYLGLARITTVTSQYASNFGDMDITSILPTLNIQNLENDLDTWLSGNLAGPELQQMSEKVQADFDTKKISLRIFRLYESSYFLRNYSSWIPILMYHKIPASELKSQHKIYVTQKRFKKHLQFFKSFGFQTLTFSDLKKFKSGLLSFEQFPKKPLILTFDDGYKDNLDYASPLLKKYNFKAQLFLLADPDIDSNKWDHSETEPSHEIISGADRLKWKDSAFEIGSHGFSHQKITGMNEADARLELRKSKQDLETEFQKNIPVYAFTYGDTNDKTADLALEEGYDYAVNTDTGGLLLEEDPYKIFRVNIFPNETVFSLFKKTSRWYRSYYFKKRKK